MKRFWLWNLKWSPVYHFAKGNYRKGFAIFALNIVLMVFAAAAVQQAAEKQVRDRA